MRFTLEVELDEAPAQAMKELRDQFAVLPEKVALVAELINPPTIKIEQKIIDRHGVKIGKWTLERA